MRTRTAPENTILDAAVKAVTAVRVEIRDAGGVYQDWFSRLLSGSWGASIDQPIAEVRLSLIRDSGPTASLSPFRGDSTLNTGGAAIDAGRAIRISPATTAWGTAAVSGDFKLLFDGKIGPIEFANRMEIIGRDLGGFLVTRQIKEDSEIRDPAGIPLEDLIQDILTEWAPGITLYTPTSPGFMVTSQNWGKGSLFDAIRTAAGGIGWDIRYLWDDATSAFRLTLFEPERTKTDPDWTLSANRYFSITQLGINPDNIRNYIQISFLNSATGQRDTVFATDTVSVGRFEEQWMEIVEGDDSPINSATEAQALADAALADLAWPIAEKQVEMPFFWPVEIGDLIRFNANGVHSVDDMDLAVTGYQHRLERGVARTTLYVRGKPAGFYRDWIRRSKLLGGFRIEDIPFFGAPVPGTNVGRAEVLFNLHLRPDTGQLDLIASKIAADSSVAGFGWFHSMIPVNALFTDSNIVFFGPGETQVIVPLPDLADEATAYVTGWGFAPAPPGAPVGSVGAAGIKKMMQITNSAFAPQLDIVIRPNRRIAMRFDVYVTITDPNNLGGTLEMWTPNSIFLGESPSLQGLRFTALATTDVLQVRDLTGAITTHQFVDGQEIRLGEEPGGDVLPSGLVPLVTYLARDTNQGAGTLKLEATVGSGAINLLSDGDGTIDGAPIATLAIASTPTTVGPANSYYLGNLIANDQDSLSLQFRFINTSGFSSGRQRVDVPPFLLTLDGLGQLNGAAVVVSLDPTDRGRPVTVGAIKSNSLESANNIGFSGHPYISQNYQGGFGSLDISAYAGRTVSVSAVMDVFEPTYPAPMIARLRFFGSGGANLLATYYSALYQVKWKDTNEFGAGFEYGEPKEWVGSSPRSPRIPIDNVVIPAGTVTAWIDSSPAITPFGTTVRLPTMTLGGAARGFDSTPTDQTVLTQVVDGTGLLNSAIQQYLATIGAVVGTPTAGGSVSTQIVMNASGTQTMINTLAQTIKNAILEQSSALIEDLEGFVEEIQNIRASIIQDAEATGLASAYTVEWMQAAKALVGIQGDFLSAVNMVDAQGLLTIWDAFTRSFGNIAVIDGGGQVLAIGPATVSDGLSPRPIVKGHIAGSCEGGTVSGATWADGTPVLFPVVFQGVPAIILSNSGGITHEPRRAMWTGAYDPMLPVRIERVAVGPSPGGFTPRCRLVQPVGTGTPRTDTYAGNTLDTNGETASVNLANAPSFDDKYRQSIQIILHSESYEPIPGLVSPGRAYIEFAIDVDDGGGFVQRASDSRVIDGDGDLNVTEPYLLTLAGLVAGDDFRVRVVSVQLLGPSSTAAVIATDVQYSTAATPLFASLTPDQASDPSDRIEYKAFSVV